VIAGKNFGSGSSRQQAVDCFASLGISAIVAESFGAIYERNAINAAFPIVVCKTISDLDISDGDTIRINYSTGLIENLNNKKSTSGEPFSKVQYEIYINGGLL
jgi:3-isopropylmalate dehydratase small subunit